MVLSAVFQALPVIFIRTRHFSISNDGLVPALSTILIGLAITLVFISFIVRLTSSPDTPICKLTRMHVPFYRATW